MDLRTFSAINLARCERWHPKGIDSWSISDWAVAAAGEMGELCNYVKKLNRLRDGLIGNNASEEKAVADLTRLIGKEIADTVIYLDLVAHRCGLDLDTLVRAKFNEVSERNGFPERL